jgi:hypothetical protein
MNMSLNLNGYKRKVDAPDELLAPIFDDPSCIKKPEDQLRRKTSELCIRVTKCTEFDCGILEYLL